ncbi:exosortase K [Hymenobacter sp. BT664]|uniref:Exosortase K n=1 Tax=Hymenobacter montanus TaxID=2771359 RepID=A0A927BES9_9BACT|nr:exosortase K [Hymenobacter montanus]MBD2768930.1 exosortase K [Hymenobacter montanus]
MSSPCRPSYVVVVAAFIAAKLLYAQATTADVRFLLAPTNALVEIMLSSTSVFDAGRGYVHPGLRIVIDKSCAGGNFWLLSWLLLAATYLHQHGRRPALAVLALVVVSFGLTLLVNAARIVGAVTLGRVLPVGGPPPGWLHEAQGALVYLFSLVAAHCALLYFLFKTTAIRAHSA